MSLILSLQMKLRKEKRLSWMIRTLGSRHRSSCLEASRCCWHFGQYLQSRVLSLVEEQKEQNQEEQFEQLYNVKIMFWKLFTQNYKYGNWRKNELCVCNVLYVLFLLKIFHLLTSVFLIYLGCICYLYIILCMHLSKIKLLLVQ